MATIDDRPDLVAGDPGPRRRRPSLGAEIAGLLRDYINSENLKNGDELPSESQLAERYSVSQRVVRDALRTLTNQGLVRTHQGKRATVSELRPVAVETYFQNALDAGENAAAELLELRLVLETKAAGLAAERANADDIAKLRRIMADLRESRGDLGLRVPLDLQFHSAIAEASRNRFFSAILEALGGVLAIERRRGGELTEAAGGVDHAESTTQHEALLEAIEDHDTERAELTMRAILVRAQRYFEGSAG